MDAMENLARYCLIFLCSSVALGLALNPIAIEEQLLWISGGSAEVTTYRAPMLLTLPNGDILAFAEGRKSSSVDAAAKFIAMRRSSDGGFSWSTQSFVIDDFEAKDGSNTGAVLYDYDTDTIFLFYVFCAHIQTCQASNSSKAVGTYMKSSSDYGYTWTASVYLGDINPKLSKLPISCGPGYGFQKQVEPHKGRLIACGHTQEYTTRRVICIVSDDHGKTWNIAGQIYSMPYGMQKKSGDLVPGEVQPLELPNGTILMTVRNTHFFHCNCRMQVKSYDGGDTFPVNEYYLDQTLVDPSVFASMLYHPATKTIFFSNPASSSNRSNMTVRWSRDYGSSWEGALPIYSGGSEYSSLVVIDDDHIGLLYEKDGYKYLMFVIIKLHGY